MDQRATISQNECSLTAIDVQMSLIRVRIFRVYFSVASAPNFVARAAMEGFGLRPTPGFSWTSLSKVYKLRLSLSSCGRMSHA